MEFKKGDLVKTTKLIRWEGWDGRSIRPRIYDSGLVGVICGEIGEYLLVEMAGDKTNPFKKTDLVHYDKTLWEV